MAEIATVVETLEHRWMRAWIAADSKALRGLTSRKFRFVLGTKPCVILDWKSWADSAGKQLVCSSYRFGDIYCRRHGSIALFATQLEIDASAGDIKFPGQVWLTDVWTRSQLRRNWQLAERVVSGTQSTPGLPQAIRSLQLWR